MAEISVHHPEHGRARRVEARHHGRPQSKLGGTVHNAHGVAAGERIGHSAGAVRRVVIHDHQFPDDPGGPEHFEGRMHQFGEAAPFVVRRDDERQLRCCVVWAWGDSVGHGWMWWYQTDSRPGVPRTATVVPLRASCLRVELAAGPRTSYGFAAGSDA